MSRQADILLERLSVERSLSVEEYGALIRERDGGITTRAQRLALAARERVYGRDVFIRGLIEVGNVCANNCYYCGIRRDNAKAQRYTLTRAEILDCCKYGYDLGFRTFVLQSGECGASDEALTATVAAIKAAHPDAAVTLSVGEKPRATYEAFRRAGADRYLLRHETADRGHYGRLHPPEMSFARRMECLGILREIGFQTGCGFMVGSPFQTVECLAKDLKFIETFRPAMVGLGPFIPHEDTPFAAKPAGSAELTLYLLALVRLILPEVLLPATTALGTIDEQGHALAMQAGANVVMPNLSPEGVRDKYLLYNNKACRDQEAAEGLAALKASMAAAGFRIVVSRGDPRSAGT